MTEFLVFCGLLLGGALVLLYRSRRSTTSWRETPTGGEPYDRASPFSKPTDARFDGAELATMRSRPVSRDEGHGKDGGG